MSASLIRNNTLEHNKSYTFVVVVVVVLCALYEGSLARQEHSWTGHHLRVYLIDMNTSQYYMQLLQALRILQGEPHVVIEWETDIIRQYRHLQNHVSILTLVRQLHCCATMPVQHPALEIADCYLQCLKIRSTRCHQVLQPQRIFTKYKVTCKNCQL